MYFLANGKIQLFLSKEESINAAINDTNHLVEIFSKTHTLGYKPTYHY